MRRYVLLGPLLLADGREEEGNQWRLVDETPGGGREIELSPEISSKRADGLTHKARHVA